MTGSGRPVRGLLVLLDALVFRCVVLSLHLILRGFWRVNVEGAAPVDGPYLIAANHRSHVDPFLLQINCPHRIHFLMTVKWRDLPVLRWFFRWARTISVPDGAAARQNLEALREARGRMEDGHVVAIFYEGGIVRPGQERESARRGVGALAEAGLPVIPVAIWGSRHCLPPTGRPRRGAMGIRWGRPIDPAEAEGSSRRERQTALARRIQEDVESLLGEEAD